MEIKPASMNDLASYMSYVQECYEDGIAHYKDAIQDIESYLQRLIDHSEGRNLPEGYCVSVTYFCVSDKKILGTIRVRQGNSSHILRKIGHIGYETRPSARNKGVAKFMLSFVIESKGLNEYYVVTCDKNNFASIRVIESVKHEHLFYENMDEDIALYKVY